MLINQKVRKVRQTTIHCLFKIYVYLLPKIVNFYTFCKITLIILYNYILYKLDHDVKFYFKYFNFSKKWKF